MVHDGGGKSKTAQKVCHLTIHPSHHKKVHDILLGGEAEFHLLLAHDWHEVKPLRYLERSWCTLECPFLPLVTVYLSQKPVAVRKASQYVAWSHFHSGEKTYFNQLQWACGPMPVPAGADKFV